MTKYHFLMNRFGGAKFVMAYKSGILQKFVTNNLNVLQNEKNQNQPVSLHYLW